MQGASRTSVHDQIPSDFRLPVVPGRLEALGEADAEVLEVAFADEGLGGAGGDERALDGQDQSWTGVEIDAVVGLTVGEEEEEEEELGSRWVAGRYMEKEPKPICLWKGSNISFHSITYVIFSQNGDIHLILYKLKAVLAFQNFHTQWNLILYGVKCYRAFQLVRFHLIAWCHLRYAKIP